MLGDTFCQELRPWDALAMGRLQICLTLAKGDRNNHRQIIGYIERDGTVTNTHRQKVGTVD